jgi:hypothetical protein
MFHTRIAVAMPTQTLRRVVLALSCLLLLLGLCAAQQSATVANNVPNLIKFSGTVSAAPSESVGVIFALYADQTGGAPLWQEVQNVAVDANGHYTSLLGSSTAAGIPLDVFSSNEARWLGVQVQGQAEQARVLLVSVPYALKAADSQTLGGLPPSAFLRADAATSTTTPTTGTAYVNSAAVNAAAREAVAAISVTTKATAGTLPVFTDGSGDLGNSLVSQVATSPGTPGNFVGVNIPAAYTAGPAATLDVVDSNPTLRVDNYTGYVYTPGSVTSSGSGNSPNFNFISANGTAGSPLATLNGDNLGQFAGTGYSGSGFPGSKVKVNFLATENWGNLTPALPGGNGTAIAFLTTKNKTISRNEAMRIDNTGYVGILTTLLGNHNPLAPLEVYGNIMLSQGSQGEIIFPDNTYLYTASTIPNTTTNNTYTGNQTITGSVTTSGTVSATGNINVDQSGLNNGKSASPGLLFGPAAFGGGDGIGSGQAFGSSNPFGLDFYTNNTKAMSITNEGSVGIATQTPAAALEADTNARSTYPVSLLGSVAPISGTGQTQTGYLVGVWGDIGGSSDSGVGVLGTADENYAGYFANTSTNSNYPALYVENEETANSTSLVFETSGTYNGKVGTCIVNVSGDLTCTGSIGAAVGVSSSAGRSAAADTATAAVTATRLVALHNVQSPENWFEDFGSGTLSSGTATITLDPTFAQTVNTGVEYHVFVTPKGDCKGLYVAQESASSFEVRELGGGLSSNVAFDYRIVAKRAGFESARLEDVTEQVKKQVLHKQLQHPKHTPSAAAKSVAAH